MAKRTISKKERQELDLKGIAIIIAVVAIAYLLYTNMLALLVATFGTLILIIVILVVGAYFVLPRLGIAGLTALLSFGRK